MGEESNSAPTAAASATAVAAGSSTASNSASPSIPSPASSGKRSRDPEDEVYLDNFHSHKRYLSEIMASSLNGLTVGDQLRESVMESPSRSETLFYPRDEMALQYSPMSEDSDDSRFCETPINTCSSQPESLATSPVSPYRYQRPLGGLSSAASTSLHPLNSCSVNAVACSQHRQRGSDSEGRFPSSPSDICHSADLRRAALLRSVQMRTQLPGQDAAVNMETEDRPCLYMKSLVDDRDYRIDESSSMGIAEPDFNPEKPCRALDMNMNVKGDDLGD